MDFESALAWWHARIDYERRPPRPGELSLDRMRSLLARLGQPQDRLRIVHIAGSKGKGSTAAMFAAVGAAAGLRTGLYTSPHLLDVRERIQLNGEPISEPDLARALFAVRDAADPEDPPTFFEIGTAAAYRHFADRRVELAVVEVGLGGQFDATNVCRPALSVIEIAAAKSGIIKPGVPVVSGVVESEPAEVIRRVARERGSPLVEVIADGAAALGAGPTPVHWRYRGKSAAVRENGTVTPARLVASAPGDRREFDSPVGLIGGHQLANATIVTAGCDILRQTSVAIPETAVRAGLSAVRWPGRFDVFRGPPLTILDCAHNAASAQAVVTALNESFPALPRTLLLATAADKDAAGMFRALLPSMASVILTRFTTSPRATPPLELEAIARQCRPDLPIIVTDEPHEALAVARRQSRLLLICGSVFLAGELRPRLVELG
jgi:dihydrofolate synthase/folylpolyglutamate synthase